MTVTFARLHDCGRLGNQLWEVASSIGIAERRGEPVALPASWVYRDVFSLPDHVFADEPLDGDEAWTLPEAAHLGEFGRYYLQDLTLWANVAHRIRDWLAPSPSALDAIATQLDRLAQLPAPVLAVHVRRGDNATAPNDSFPMPTPDYYRRAIALAPPCASVAVFSDDPEWCRNEFAPGGQLHRDDPCPVVVFGSGPRAKEHEDGYATDPVTDWIDLHLMARCDAHVLSNSTFGWWGAWLARGAGVCYPTPWYGPGLADELDAGLMFPSHWQPVGR